MWKARGESGTNVGIVSPGIQDRLLLVSRVIKLCTAVY